MAKEHFTELSDELLMDITEKSLINAERLLKDADLLQENKSFPTAAALYQLSMEEVGKAIYAYLPLLFHYKDYPSHIKSFDKGFYNHMTKSEKSSFMDLFIGKHMYERKPEKLRDFIVERKGNLSNKSVPELDEMRNYCFYTSYQKGKVVLPSQYMQEQSAHSLSLMALVRYKWAKGFIQISLPELLEMREHLENNPIDQQKMVDELVKEFFQPGNNEDTSR